ncbi:GTP 3',8-cyclase [Methanimicrococcus hongohii]|uniref:GTP 3',8-cyclase n=1 Tax=Methanimicrococcus hongohii TaxID=3028295 RepID=A0AA96V1A0_9EURY|nr:radical SAM protein [Methanimicrococcus sp. Hf6]WNY24025.1 GTP 3',8-cyclase [Methanimicrococcus sp. Hf6]
MNPFKLNSLMSNAVTSAAFMAMNKSLRNEKEREFISKMIPALKEDSKIRDGWEKKGVHIPPFIITGISTECNLRCSGCYSRAFDACGDSSKKNEMTSKEWKNIFSQADDLGISIILLAGGEPMVRKDILETAAEFPKILFPIFTNGTMIDEEAIDFFDKNRNLIPVLSIEGKKEETNLRRGEGVYEKVEESVKKMTEKGLFFGFSITLTNENIHATTSIEFVSELESNGCSAIFYVEYVPAQKGSESLVLTETDRDFQGKQMKILRNKFKNLIFMAFPEDEKYLDGCLAAGRGFFYINAFGGAEPCPFSPFSDMNLKDHTILEALESPLFRKLREDGILEQEHHGGGCILFENKESVSKFMADSIQSNPSNSSNSSNFSNPIQTLNMMPPDERNKLPVLNRKN